MRLRAAEAFPGGEGLPVDTSDLPPSPAASFVFRQVGVVLFGMLRGALELPLWRPDRVLPHTSSTQRLPPASAVPWGCGRAREATAGLRDAGRGARRRCTTVPPRTCMLHDHWMAVREPCACPWCLPQHPASARFGRLRERWNGRERGQGTRSSPDRLCSRARERCVWGALYGI